MQKYDITVLQVIPYAYYLHPGGLEKIAQTIHTGLEKDFCMITYSSNVTTAGGGAGFVEEGYILAPSFEIVPHFPVPLFWKKTFRSQLHQLKCLRPKIVITHTRFFLQSMVGGILAKIRGVKRIHIEHGSGFVTGYPWYIKFCARLFDRTIGLRIFRQCDTIVTISSMHQQFIKRFTTKEPHVIYNPIHFLPQEKTQNTLTHIGFIGRLVPLKGVDILIDALNLLEHKEWRCTIVGDGMQRKSLEAQVQMLGLENRIHFVGADDRGNWLHMFDVFVNPSLQEGVPTTVIEALMAKCIVVATDVGGTNEISSEDDLILCKAGDVIDLQQKLLTSFEHLNKSGLSYATVIQRFGGEASLSTYRNLIKESIF